jgi:hypothetical protein
MLSRFILNVMRERSDRTIGFRSAHDGQGWTSALWWHEMCGQQIGQTLLSETSNFGEFVVAVVVSVAL